MKRKTMTIIASLLLAVACLALAVAPVAQGANSELLKPRAALSTRCVVSQAVSNAKRKLIATATMRPVAGTQKLAVMFLLQDKVTGTPTFATLDSPALGIWISPTDPPTLGQKPSDVWRVKQPVEGLYLGNTYRFEVKFRWYGSGAQVIKHTTLYSAPCVQPEPLASGG